MKVSLISPLFNESLVFESHLQDIKSFFARFPVEIEMILVIPEDDQQTLTKYKESQSPEFQVVVLRTPNKDRASAVWSGLNAASGDIQLIFSWDLSIPLAEFFNFIQELVQNRSLHMVLGNRFDPKKRNHVLKSTWHQTLSKIITEKLKAQGWRLNDPLTPFVALRKFDKALLKDLKMKGWYYTPSLIKWAYQQNWQIEEASVVHKQSSEHQKKSGAPLFKEFLRHLF